MRKLLIVLFLIVFSMSHAQDRADGTFVVHIMNTDAVDLKCDVYPGEVKISEIQDIMNNNRYVMSVAHTKFGTIVVHKKNVDSVQQLYAVIPSWDLEKECKERKKEGYILDYYNDEKNYAIFRKDTKVTQQVFLGSIDQKKLKKQNAKGLYATLYCSYATVAQDGRDDIQEQKYASYIGLGEFLKGFKVMAADSWVVGSVTKSYNKHSNLTFYRVIYDKLRKEYDGREALAALDTKEELIDFLGKHIESGYNINRIWCGWENRDYEADEARAAAYDGNIFNILTGLTNSISGLTGKGNGQSSTNASNNETSTQNSGGNNSKSKAGNGKCKRCQGSGKCSPVSGSGRHNACYGSGLCGYCNGTGWVKAGSSEAKCSACNGKGKCKTCNGTGKCPLCHGTGH